MRYRSAPTAVARHLLILTVLTVLPACGQAPQGVWAAGHRPFKITVVDDQTARGVPLVELATVNNLRYYTDSNGNVAFYEPGLMNRRVFFYVRSHGYQYPQDGFGYEGLALDVREGGEALVRIHRRNIAERLYRVTGEGIYSDTCLLGESAPTQQPLLNGQVVGQDSVQAAVYHGKIYWFWGDTNRPGYPLGHFQTAGATSLLPGRGGLPPSVGVDLHYFVDSEGFSKKMCPMSRGDEPFMVWIDAVMTVPDDSGQERLVARYAQMKSLESMLEQGLAVFNDKTEVFEKVAEFDVKEPWRYPQGHPVRFREGGEEFLLFPGFHPAPGPFPVVRVKSDLRHVTDPASYEAFTCLRPGTRYDKTAAAVERDAQGRLVWGWKPDTDPVGSVQEDELLAAGKLKPEEARFQLRDAETGQPVELHCASFCWNDYRKKWILIGEEVNGTSFLGEIWFAEADSPVGPWSWARKIVTHEQYSFYNPTQHRFFDEDGGRIIYFEGTYSITFSGNEHPTPRYDYNQIMYRLDLSDPRLRPRDRP
jgi:hypothetical protein